MDCSLSRTLLSSNVVLTHREHPEVVFYFLFKQLFCNSLFLFFAVPSCPVGLYSLSVLMDHSVIILFLFSFRISIVTHKYFVFILLERIIKPVNHVNNRYHGCSWTSLVTSLLTSDPHP